MTLHSRGAGWSIPPDDDFRLRWRCGDSGINFHQAQTPLCGEGMRRFRKLPDDALKDFACACLVVTMPKLPCRQQSEPFRTLAPRAALNLQQQFYLSDPEVGS